MLLMEGKLLPASGLQCYDVMGVSIIGGRGNFSPAPIITVDETLESIVLVVLTGEPTCVLTVLLYKGFSVLELLSL